ncbi:Basic-leucine zipper domain [Macleaya cordata]|uniref:Basic-leucine zipper domain n=1 Tax=Macleaya cordata TaxID=56857 RepID=A0A200R926_MACCD|nr:Basic-leucine zipper domain [Macleaya cordata]OVA19186.1 Basic-leucine zipper domain [Macleaya cordata]
MGSGEEGTPAKPSTATASTQQETPPTPSYSDWSTHMQAYYGAAATPPPFFTSSVASPTPHPYMWGGQHLIPPPYGTPLPYPALYPHGGLYPHPGMPSAQDAAQTTRETEGKGPDGKERVSTKKSKGNSGNTGASVGKSGESAKVTSGSGNDGASQSAESGSEGASESSDDNNNQQEVSATKKKSFNQMLADGTPFVSEAYMLYLLLIVSVLTLRTLSGANAQNNDTAEYSGAAVANLPTSVPGKPAGMPGTNLNIGMDLWNTSPVGTVPLRARPNASGVSSAVVPAKMVGREGVPAEHLWVQQDERELKRQKRKQSNRESARRSRLRKQAECEELQAKVETLSSENHNLHKELQRLSEECEKLATENKSLMEELGQLYGPDAISTLDANMSNQPVNGEGTGQDDSRGNNNSVSGQTNGVLFSSNNNLEPGSK